MAEDAGKTRVLDAALAVWSRRRWLAILVFAAPFAAAAGMVAFLPNIYRSSATILVDRQQVPEAFVRPTVTSELEVRLHTISQEILSRSRLESLIARFGLYADLRKHLAAEEVIERMRRDIELTLKGVDQRQPQKGSTISFAIGYRGSDPRTVAQVTNTLASFYIEENLKVRERQAAGTAEFLKVQLADTKKRLDEQERRVSDFKKRYTGELPQQMQANLSTHEQLNNQLRLNSVSQIRTEEKRELLAMQLGLPDPSMVALTGEPRVGPGPAAVRLAKLKQDLADARTQFSDKYPDVIRMKAEIAALEQEIAQARPETAEKGKEPAIALNPQTLRLRQAMSEADAELKILKDEEKRLRNAIALYQQRIENVPRREQEFLELSRDYDTTRELYTSLTRRHDEAQLAESMEQRQKGEQFRILDSAVPSAEPAAPNRLQLIFVGLVISLGLAAGAVVVAEQIDSSFHTLDDLRGFATVPILASIPVIVTGTDLRRRQWRARLTAVVAIVCLTAIVAGSYFVAKDNERLVWTLTRSRAAGS